jgi:predicted ester cyclase
MTHTGTFATPAGEIPPTGNRVELDACDVVRIGSDGRITSWHSYFDQASMMAQLGAVPAAG